MAQTKIKVTTSIHGKFKNGKHFDLVAGEDYWVDEAKADEFIIKGYAVGELSRNYSDDEKAQIRASVQVIQGPGVANG